MKNSKITGKSLFAYYMKGTALGMGICAILLCLFAFILTVKDVSAAVLPYALISAGGVGSFVCAVAASKNKKLRGIVSGLLGALVFSAVFLPLCFICSGFKGLGYILIMAGVNLLLGCAGGIVSKNLR